MTSENPPQLQSKTKPNTEKSPRLWKNISGWLNELIQSGALQKGDKLPSIRSLAEQFSVSVSTVQRALNHLERLGLVQTMPRSCNIVIAKSVAHVAYNFQGVDVRVDKDVASMLADAGRPDLQALGSAILSDGFAAEVLLKRCIRSIARDGATLISGFSAPPGDLNLRKHIAGFMMRRGVVCGPDDIIVTAGDTVALELGLMATGKPGDKVIVEDPTYFGILQAIEHVGMRAVPIDTCARKGINLEVIEKALESGKFASIFLNPNLQNPLGFIMPLKRRVKLAQMAAKAGVTIVEDDVFFDLLPPNLQVDVIKSYDPDNVIYCSSFTKTIAPGFRVGWCIPGRHRDAILAQMFGRNLSVSSVPQKVLAEFMARGYHEKHLMGLRKNILTSSNKIGPILKRHFPADITYRPPIAGFVHWIVLPDTIDLPLFHSLVKKAGIVIAKGEIFSATGATKNGLRICLARKFDPTLASLIAQVGACAIEATMRYPSSVNRV